MRLLALLAALLTIAPDRALAACDAANQFTFDWNSQPDTSLSYASTYSYTATNASGASRTFQTSFATNGLATNNVAGFAMPVIAAVHTGTTGAGEKTLTLGGRLSGRTAAIGSATRVIAVTFTFSQPVRDVSFRVFDVDFTANSWRDWIRVTGSNGAATYNASFTKPAASTVRIGPGASPQPIAAGELLGASASDLAQDNGTVVATFAQPVTSVQLRYGNYPLQTGETATGEQWISIHDISFCPLPSLAVTKTSAPLATTGTDRFAAPGSDMVYTITAANSGGSPVDLNGLVLTDVLPAQMSFYNGDFDTTLPGTDPFVLTAGSSGVTLTAANVSYSNNGGASYAYAPAAGYDANVSAVRFAPGGSLAANSSFTIRFRARVK
jgi:uncharacterized repeat protein (TIGR01451 family)